MFNFIKRLFKTKRTYTKREVKNPYYSKRKAKEYRKHYYLTVTKPKLEQKKRRNEYQRNYYHTVVKQKKAHV